jgi:hypothetical protein
MHFINGHACSSEEWGWYRLVWCRIVNDLVQLSLVLLARYANICWKAREFTCLLFVWGIFDIRYMFFLFSGEKKVYVPFVDRSLSLLLFLCKSVQGTHNNLPSTRTCLLADVTVPTWRTRSLESHTHTYCTSN